MLLKIPLQEHTTKNLPKNPLKIKKEENYLDNLLPS